MKKKRSRAIPPILVQCEKQRVDDLRTSIKKSIDLLAEEKLAVEYHMSENQIRAIEFRGDAFTSHEIIYTKANLMCVDDGFAWTYRPHLPLSQMPEPYGARDVIAALKMALRTVERASTQSLSRLQKTIEINDKIADIMAFWIGSMADNLNSVTISLNPMSTKIQAGPSNPMSDKDKETADLWLAKMKQCLFIQMSQSQVILGCGSIERDLPISPLNAMQAIKDLSALYPDLQLPRRA